MSLSFANQAILHNERVAVIDEHGKYTYGDLLDASTRVASALLRRKSDLREARVAFMVPSGFEYVAVLWGIWRAGGVAVPIGISHPLPEVEFILEDSAAEIVIADPHFETELRFVADVRNARFVSTSEAMDIGGCSLPTISSDRRAMILYTSGTTSKPKGVVSTHQNIAAQIVSLVEAWEWTDNDHILNVLPLDHTHGIINVLSCALWSGATCEMLPKFDAERVWERFVNNPLTLFMAVSTIYVKLIDAWRNES